MEREAAHAAPTGAGPGVVSMNIVGFDHLVLKCGDVAETLAWYCDRLGLAPVRVDEWRAGTVPFPSVRVSPGTIIDLVPRAGDVAEPNVDHLCLVADRATVEAIANGDAGLTVVDQGTRFGARGDGESVYVLDPDGTTVEIRYYP